MTEILDRDVGKHWRLEDSESGENLQAQENRSTTQRSKHTENRQTVAMVNVSVQQWQKMQDKLELLTKQQTILLDEQRALKQSLNRANSRVDRLENEVAMARAGKGDTIMAEDVGQAERQLWGETAHRMRPRSSVSAICGEVLRSRAGTETEIEGRRCTKRQDDDDAEATDTAADNANSITKEPVGAREYRNAVIVPAETISNEKGGESAIVTTSNSRTVSSNTNQPEDEPNRGCQQ